MKFLWTQRIFRGCGLNSEACKSNNALLSTYFLYYGVDKIVLLSRIKTPSASCPFFPCSLFPCDTLFTEYNLAVSITFNFFSWKFCYWIIILNVFILSVSTSSHSKSHSHNMGTFSHILWSISWRPGWCNHMVKTSKVFLRTWWRERCSLSKDRNLNIVPITALNFYKAYEAFPLVT